MAHRDAFDDGTTGAGTEFTANDFRIKRALDAIVRSATAIKDDVAPGGRHPREDPVAGAPAQGRRSAHLVGVNIGPLEGGEP
jgi:hypothetical protein